MRHRGLYQLWRVRVNERHATQEVGSIHDAALPSGIRYIKSSGTSSSVDLIIPTFESPVRRQTDMDRSLLVHGFCFSTTDFANDHDAVGISGQMTDQLDGHLHADGYANQMQSV